LGGKLTRAWRGGLEGAGLGLAWREALGLVCKGLISGYLTDSFVFGEEAMQAGTLLQFCFLEGLVEQFFIISAF